MAKSTAANIITRVKRRIDYDITDTNLDNLLYDILNDTIKLVKQWLFDAGVFYDITGSASFQTVPGQEYRDISKAIIVGNVATFTGTANDKIKVTIDSTDYDDIDVSGDASIADVVSAINTAVGSTVAYTNSTSSTLEIRSLTTGSSSNVTIADGGTTGQTVVAELFSTAADRTASGIADVDSILQLSERVNDTSPIITIPYNKFLDMFPDPTADSTSTPIYASLHNGRIYFGPRPSSYNRVYIDYVKLMARVVSGSTMPFEDKYDQLVYAQMRLEWLMYFDANNSAAITAGKALRDDYKQQLITAAARTYNQVQQSASRNDSIFIGPQVPDS